MKFLNNGVISKNNGVMSKNNGVKSVDSFTKKLFLIVAQEQKLFLILELKDSFGMLRLLPRTFTAGPE